MAIQINLSDIRIDTITPSIANAETTYRLLHIPSGCVIEGKSVNGKSRSKLTRAMIEELDRAVQEKISDSANC